MLSVTDFIFIFCCRLQILYLFFVVGYRFYFYILLSVTDFIYIFCCWLQILYLFFVVGYRFYIYFLLLVTDFIFIFCCRLQILYLYFVVGYRFYIYFLLSVTDFIFIFWKYSLLAMLVSLTHLFRSIRYFSQLSTLLFFIYALYIPIHNHLSQVFCHKR